MPQTLKLETPPGRVKAALMSHGWSRLPVFDCAPDLASVRFGVRTDAGHPIVALRDVPDGVVARVEGRFPLTEEKLRAVAQDVLGLDVDLAAFWRICRRDPRFGWVARRKLGAILRCPSVWEDLLALLASTNCNWSRTVANVSALCSLAEGTSSLPVFPTAENLIQAGVKGLRRLRLGFRARYVTELARAATCGEVPTRNQLQHSEPEAARKRLEQLPGVGPYVSETLLRISGVPDFYGLDSWNRTQVPAARNGDRKRLDREYKEFGSWRGLAFWFDATAHWYRDGTDWP